MEPDILLSTRRPSRTVSVLVSLALVLLWAIVRLVVFDTTMLPLTYVLPLLVCVWTRDGVALWIMAAIFVGLHLLNLFWVLPAGTLTPDELWANLAATVANICVGAAAVNMIIGLRNRLEATLDDVRAQADELRAQGEELAQQNEELQSQAAEIGGLNDTLERQERLLETLLDLTRLSPTESEALEHIGRAALDLFGREVAAVAVFEAPATQGSLRRAFVSSVPNLDPEQLPAREFVPFVVAAKRPAALDDLSLRPDLAPAGTQVRAVLGAPIRLGEHASAAFLVYAVKPRTWRDEEFRLAEWLAGQCERVLLALRLHADLRELDRRKSEFLATLSHELRNPLAPMRYALELIQTGRADDGKALPILTRQFQQLVRLVDDLLDATRLSSNKIQVRKSRVDLGAIVRHAVDGCRPDIEGARHTLTVDLPGDSVWVDADTERLAQVVTNLLNNAIRYTPAGGRIGLSLTTTAEQAQLIVRDNGMGLDRADLDRVFEMFTQVGGAGSDGLGIGLALVRGIVELHGGRVEAHSDGKGQGSSFRVTLPLADPQTSVTGPASLSATTCEPQRVLVVDDNTDAASLLGVLLEAQGHDVRIAHDAKAALAIHAEFVADVALLDIGLPGTSGYDLARQLRASAARPLRLIAVTGWGQDGDRERARAAGFDGHLTKPAQLDTLLAALSGEA